MYLFTLIKYKLYFYIYWFLHQKYYNIKPCHQVSHLGLNFFIVKLSIVFKNNQGSPQLSTESFYCFLSCICHFLQTFCLSFTVIFSISPRSLSYAYWNYFGYIFSFTLQLIYAAYLLQISQICEKLIHK